MQIRRNTKPFKTILEIVATCQMRPDRTDLIRVYITKAGTKLGSRVSVEGTKGEAVFFYDLAYQQVMNNLKSSVHQLHQSDEIPGMYYFNSTLNKDWDETPFEFDVKVKEAFATLPELPTTRAKGKAQEFVLPAHDTKPQPAGTKAEKKEKVVERKATMFIDRGPKQPDYRLKHDIHFSDLDRIAFRQPQLSRKDVLDHYNKISEYLLPYLKDRPLFVRQQAESGPNVARANMEALPKKASTEVPSWIQSIDTAEGEMFLCNDKEHLLYYAELGCVEFDSYASQKKSLSSPDYVIIGIDSGSDFSKVIEVTLAAHEILEGLRLPSFVKTDGVSGLHLYIPLDSKDDYETSQHVAEYLCKLIRLKVPNLVALIESDDLSYGKVSLNHLLNGENKGVVAPYSFVAGTPAMVATPLLWDEVTEGLRLDEFNHETIFERLKKVGDPFETMYKKKLNARELAKRLEESYSFLF